MCANRYPVSQNAHFLSKQIDSRYVTNYKLPFPYSHMHFTNTASLIVDSEQMILVTRFANVI